MDVSLKAIESFFIFVSVILNSVTIAEMNEFRNLTFIFKINVFKGLYVLNSIRQAENLRFTVYNQTVPFLHPV